MQSYEKVSDKSPKVLLKLNIQMRSIDGNFAGNKLTVLISIAQKDGIEATKIAEAFDLSRGTTSNVILSLSPQPYLRRRNGELKEGLGLLIQEPSMNDRGAKELHFTLEDKQFIGRLIKILQAKQNDKEILPEVDG